MLKALLPFLLLSFSMPCLGAGAQLAEREDYYYGSSVKQNSPKTLKEKLHYILKSFHISKSGQNDQIVTDCGKNSGDNCYAHVRHGYKKARQYMFGHIYLEGSGKNSYSIESVYCGDKIDNSVLPEDRPLGPMMIPDSKTINAEHAWPQSRFSGQFPKALQKSDLHALYPVKMKVNSTRGNVPFGEVVSPTNEPCFNAALGKDDQNNMVFEPADNIKGDLARSLFYFSVRYKIAIDDRQENVLRQWHQQDPIDLWEKAKHQEVFEIQHVRNPFVDHPEWVAKIQNF